LIKKRRSIGTRDHEYRFHKHNSFQTHGCKHDSPAAARRLLRIDPTGPIADVFGQYGEHAQPPGRYHAETNTRGNRPGLLLDKNADGVVDAVRIIFKKSVSLNDLSISLTWGDLNPAYADSIPTGRLSYFGSDSLGIEINVAGAFKTISADSIKTSGHMQATVSFNSMPENPAEATDVADSAAPVIMSAQYMPSADQRAQTRCRLCFRNPWPRFHTQHRLSFSAKFRRLLLFYFA